MSCWNSTITIRTPYCTKFSSSVRSVTSWKNSEAAESANSTSKPRRIWKARVPRIRIRSQ
jgi:hypothetical protein